MVLAEESEFNDELLDTLCVELFRVESWVTSTNRTFTRIRGLLEPVHKFVNEDTETNSEK